MTTVDRATREGRKADPVPLGPVSSEAQRTRNADSDPDSLRHVLLRLPSGARLEATVAGVLTPQGRMAVATLRPAAPLPATPRTLIDAVGRSVDAALCVVDDQGRLIWWNAAAERLAGGSLTDGCGEDAHAVLHPLSGPWAHPVEACPFHRSARADDDDVRAEDRVVGANGVNVAVSQSTVPLIEDGIVRGLVVRFDDLRERRRRHARLRRARLVVRRQRSITARARQETRRLAGREAAKTRVLTMASHELRGPLTVLHGYLSMAAAGTFGCISAEMQQVLPILDGKVRLMNAMVDNMLDAARLEDGRLELSPRRWDLRDLVRRALEDVDELRTPRHPLIVDLPAAPVPADVDGPRITLVLANLIGNAVKYSPSGGRIELRVAAAPNKALVSVRDHGVGISEDGRRLLFTRFGRIITPQTRHITGTGLGLYLSRELARLSGGDITAESTPGIGSVFTVELPLSASDAPSGGALVSS